MQSGMHYCPAAVSFSNQKTLNKSFSYDFNCFSAVFRVFEWKNNEKDVIIRLLGLLGIVGDVKGVRVCLLGDRLGYGEDMFM